MNENTCEDRIEERSRVIEKIVQLILDEMDHDNAGGNLTTTFAIRVLEDTIRRLEKNALMRPLKSFLE